MQYQEVKSSNIKALAHNPETNIMGVIFNSGTEYHYENIPLELYSQIVNAESVGRAFSQLVKTQPESYPFRRHEKSK